VNGEITFWLKKVEIMNTEMRIFSGKGKKVLTFFEMRCYCFKAFGLSLSENC
jgi:hypothetical protein